MDDLIIRLAQELALHEPRIGLELRYGGQRGLSRLHLLLLVLQIGLILEQVLALVSLASRLLRQLLIQVHPVHLVLVAVWIDLLYETLRKYGIVENDLALRLLLLF